MSQLKILEMDLGGSGVNMPATDGKGENQLFHSHTLGAHSSAPTLAGPAPLCYPGEVQDVSSKCCSQRWAGTAFLLACHRWQGIKGRGWGISPSPILTVDFLMLVIPMDSLYLLWFLRGDYDVTMIAQRDCTLH